MLMNMTTRSARRWVSVMAFLVFGVLGCVVWVFFDDVIIFPLHELVKSLGKPFLMFGLPAAFLGYCYSKAMNKTLTFVTFWW